MSNIIEVEITISQLVHDLRMGLTWFASEDKGYGSIQATYQMENEDIEDIMCHPVFQQPIRRFKIIDDYTKKSVTTPTPKKVETVVDNTEEVVTEETGALEFFSL